ncbi:unnamed protein product [Cunninghamella blakesleeana]
MVIPYLLEEWQREADIVTKDEQGVVKAVGNYYLKQTLGKGSMGKVKLGVHVTSGTKAAIKIVPRAPRLRKLTAKEISREIRAVREGHLMMLLDHPHIIHLRDMIAGSHYYYFLMEFVSGGQLLHYIVKRDRLTEKHARHFSRQIISALDYMHRNSVVHRDLKIENILVDKTGDNIKIIDFGLSNLFCPERQLTTYCGSLYFAAPELLNGCPYRGPEIDVWSFGVVLYVMITGSVPFDDKSLPGLHEKIKRAQVAYPAHISSSCHNLLSRIFIADSQQRITLADIILHPWLNDGGHLDYIQNHLPYREPLSLPLDENVLQHMTYGFNLGSIDDIRMKLEVILQSSVYRISATHVSEVQLQFLNRFKNKTNHHNNNNNDNNKNKNNSNNYFIHHSNNNKKHKSKNKNKSSFKIPSSSSLGNNSINNNSAKFSDTSSSSFSPSSSSSTIANHIIWGSYNDPQNVPAAYHPLLSIYYLTRERLQCLKEINNKNDGIQKMKYNNDYSTTIYKNDPFTSSTTLAPPQENSLNPIIIKKPPIQQQQQDTYYQTPNLDINDQYIKQQQQQFLTPISNVDHHRHSQQQKRSSSHMLGIDQYETKLPSSTLKSPISHSISPTPTTPLPLSPTLVSASSTPISPLTTTNTNNTTLSKEKANLFMRFSSLFKKKGVYNSKSKLYCKTTTTTTTTATHHSKYVSEKPNYVIHQNSLINNNNHQIKSTHHQKQNNTSAIHASASSSSSSSSSSTACLSINLTPNEKSIVKHQHHRNNIHQKNSGWIVRRLNTWIDNASILNRHVTR